MTLKLVSDNGDVVSVGGLGLSSALRDLADRIDAGEYPAADRMIAIIDDDGVLTRELLGADMTGFELVGMLEQVKTAALFSGD